jgi:hypothetical protein
MLVVFFLELFFEPEDADITFIRNVSKLLPDYTTLHIKRLYA